jgi:hypothetical protein
MRCEHASSLIQKELEKGILTEKDFALFREFIATQESGNNISLARINKLVFTLVGWMWFIGPVYQLTIQEVYSGVSTLKTAESERGTPFRHNILSDFVMI